MSKAYWYLAGPYTPTKEGLTEEQVYAHLTVMYYEHRAALGALLNNKIWAYSPIVHSHDVNMKLKLPTDALFWSTFNHMMIDHSRGVVVVMMEDWNKSKGVRAEIEYARKTQKDIRFILPPVSPGLLPVEDIGLLL